MTLSTNYGKPANLEQISIESENNFSGWLTAVGPGPIDASLLLNGTWSATVTVQIKRSSDSDASAVDVGSLTANGVTWYKVPHDYLIRFGVKTGGYSSGTVAGEIAF